MSTKSCADVAATILRRDTALSGLKQVYDFNEGVVGIALAFRACGRQFWRAHPRSSVADKWMMSASFLAG